jgi:hypothetical protein
LQRKLERESDPSSAAWREVVGALVESRSVLYHDGDGLIHPLFSVSVLTFGPGQLETGVPAVHLIFRPRFRGVCGSTIVSASTWVVSADDEILGQAEQQSEVESKNVTIAISVPFERAGESSAVVWRLRMVDDISGQSLFIWGYAQLDARLSEWVSTDDTQVFDSLHGRAIDGNSARFLFEKLADD